MGLGCKVLGLCCSLGLMTAQANADIIGVADAQASYVLTTSLTETEPVGAVTSVGELETLLTTRDAAPEAFSTVELPFDDGTLVGLTSASYTSSEFLANTDASAAPVGVTFELLAGRRIEDVLTRLDYGRLGSGIHVEGYTAEGNDALVKDGAPVVPTPSALVLASIGAAMVGWVRRRVN